MYVNIKDNNKRKELILLLEKKSFKYKNFKRNQIIESDLPIHIYENTKEIGMVGNSNYVKVSKIKYTDLEKALIILNKER
jgi:hypothetical protein